MAQLRTRLGWSVGSLGAALGLAALGTYLGAVQRANELETWDPGARGFVSASNGYLRLQNAVMPLAFSSGALMASAIAVVRRPYQRRHWLWSVGTLVGASALLGAGVALMVRDPQLVSGDVERPSLQAGALLSAAALPLFTFGVLSSSSPAGERAQISAALPFRMTW